MTDLKPTRTDPRTDPRTVIAARETYALTTEQLKEAMALYFEAKGVSVRNAEMIVIVTDPRRDYAYGRRSSGVTVVLKERG